MRIGALALLLAIGGCIDKPAPPGERLDGGGGGDDDGGGPVDGDGGPCESAALGDAEAWLDTDEIRFDRAQGRVNGDCLDDLVIPGSRAADGPGVFVVLGRSENMLTGGFDSFVDTVDHIAADVRLVDLVSDESLDLVVLAQKGAADDSATILIYEGDGEGSFSPTFVADNTADGVALAIGSPGFAGALFIDTIQLDADAPPSLIYGDADTVLTLSPDDWENAVAVRNTSEVPPAGVSIEPGGLTDVFHVPSGTDGVEDFVLLDADQLEWYARQTADAYVPEPMEAAANGIGRAAFGQIDGEDELDVVYSRAQGVAADLLVRPGAPADPGSSTQLLFDPDPAFPGAIGQWSDLILTETGDDGQSDLVLVGLDGDSDTTVAFYPDLREDMGDLVSSTGETRDVERVGLGPPYDRVVAGAFRQPGVVELFLLTSHPGEVGALCLDPATLVPCL